MREKYLDRLENLPNARWEVQSTKWVPTEVADVSQEFYAHRLQGRSVLRWNDVSIWAEWGLYRKRSESSEYDKMAAVRFRAVNLLQFVSCSQLLQWLTSHGGWRRTDGGLTATWLLQLFYYKSVIKYEVSWVIEKRSPFVLHPTYAHLVCFNCGKVHPSIIWTYGRTGQGIR